MSDSGSITNNTVTFINYTQIRECGYHPKLNPISLTNVHMCVLSIAYMHLTTVILIMHYYVHTYQDIFITTLCKWLCQQKPTTTPKVIPVETNAVGKNMVWFTTKPASRSITNTLVKNKHSYLSMKVYPCCEKYWCPRWWASSYA